MNTLQEKPLPFQKNGKRDYKREKAWDHKHDGGQRLKDRDVRNKARQEMIKAGKAQVGDGKDVDHRTPLSKGGSTGKSNLRVVPASENRSFRRNPDGSLKSQTSKRERKGRK
jgi:hypothetical protein